MTIGWQLEEVGASWSKLDQHLVPVERYSKENTEVETKRSSLRKTECPRLSRRNQAMGAKVLFGPPAEEPIKRQPKLSNGHG